MYLRRILETIGFGSKKDLGPPLLKKEGGLGIQSSRKLCSTLVIGPYLPAPHLALSGGAGEETISFRWIPRNKIPLLSLAFTLIMS